MSDDPKDPPLEVLPDGGRYVGTVVDLEGVRIRQGRTPYKVKTCKHLHLIYSVSERRVWCEDCERSIDGFDAFLIFTHHFEDMERAARHKEELTNEALKSAARLRATKTLDRMWSGRVMAVLCPHCHKGILPEDFAGGADGCSRDFEIARRKRAAPPRAQDGGRK